MRIPPGSIPLLLALAVAAVYAQTLGFAFVQYDDLGYVVANPHVLRGLAVDGIAWAFSSFEMANWHPLTWLSHMLDVELYGGASGGHHATNAILHAAASALLYAALRELTGSATKSALVAALFALHPLRVEVVAWVSQRKELLAACFAFGSLWAWGRHARGGARGAYASSVLLFGASLASKPSALALPFALLLLDVWPLSRAGRAGPSGMRRLVVEKLPFAALSLASALISFVAQRSGGALVAGEAVPVELRVANAAVSCVRYLAKTLWPMGLSSFYPHPDLPGGTAWDAWQIGGSALLLAALSVAAFRARRRRAYLCVGWLWFLAMLVPVLGLVQLGEQALADRYTYLPSVGLLVAAVWALGEVLQKLERTAADTAWTRRAALAAVASVLLLLGLASWQQARHWRSSIALSERALSVAGSSPLIRLRLGKAYDAAGRADEAVAQYRAALAAQPTLDHAHYNLARLLSARGEVSAALAHYREAVRLRPDFARAHNNLGSLLRASGRHTEALHHFAEAVRADPELIPARFNLGVELVAARRFATAVEQLERVVERTAERPDAYYYLAIALYETGRFPEAARAFESFAAALAASGDPAGAAASAERAREAAQAAGDATLAARIERQLQAYRAQAASRRGR